MFDENLAFIWPFFSFQNLAFFETANGQIWPFLFFGIWQPCTFSLSLSLSRTLSLSSHTHSLSRTLFLFIRDALGRKWCQIVFWQEDQYVLIFFLFFFSRNFTNRKIVANLPLKILQYFITAKEDIRFGDLLPIILIHNDIN